MRKPSFFAYLFLIFSHVRRAHAFCTKDFFRKEKFLNDEKYFSHGPFADVTSDSKLGHCKTEKKCEKSGYFRTRWDWPSRKERKIGSPPSFSSKCRRHLYL